MVVREGKSEKKYLQRGLTAVDAKSLLGVVVNSCSNTDHKNYYSRYAVTAGPSGLSGRSNPRLRATRRRGKTYFRSTFEAGKPGPGIACRRMETSMKLKS